MADIRRADAAAILKEASATEIVQDAAQSSVVLSTFQNVRVPTSSHRIPVLQTLPTASFVGEYDGTGGSAADGQKPTSKMTWANKYLYIEEIAVIVPLHENVIEDADYDIWGQVRPRVAAEFGRKLDAAVLFGTDAPASWADADLVGKAAAASNALVSGAVGGEDLADEFNNLFALVEDDDFDVNTALAPRKLRQSLRGLRDSNGQPIYLDDFRSDSATGSIYGQPLRYVTNGAWDAAEALALVGDREAALVGVRSDLEVKFLDQATVGGINLAEYDMVALRFKMRVGFATAWPVTPNRAYGAGYPFAVLRPVGYV